MTDSRKVRECWWEGTDFHIIYDDDGSYVVYQDAYFSGEQLTPMTLNQETKHESETSTNSVADQK
jgi:hypothetical protein